jgi:hypothetical protein
MNFKKDLYAPKTLALLLITVCYSGLLTQHCTGAANRSDFVSVARSFGCFGVYHHLQLF